jgi:Tol biopolymer transport system component
MRKKLLQGRCLILAALVSFLVRPSSAQVLRPVSVVDPLLETTQGGSGDSSAPIISSDGRYVLFASSANNLALMTNDAAMTSPFPHRMNVYRRDRLEGTTVLVSANLSGVNGGNGDSMPRGLSTNGQFVVFESSASNLVANDTNNAADIFVRDLVSGTNILVSANASGKPGNGFSRAPVMAPDGRYVAFSSAATDLVSGDTNGISDVFVRDLQTGTTVLASDGAIGMNVASVSDAPEISDDGRYVTFFSTATNLVAGVKTTSEIYVRDLVGGTTILVSTNTRTVLGNINVISYNHLLNADGKFVAYAARRTSTSPVTFIFRYNRETGSTDLVHTNAIISSTPNTDRTLDMTPDGRFISFLANTNVGGKIVPVLLVWDAQTGTSTLASPNINGTASGPVEWPSLDATGRFVCFTSTATNLTTNALALGNHVYVHDMLLNETILVEAESDGGLDVVPFAIPVFSANGRFVAFESFDPQNDLVNPRRHCQIYFRDLQTNAVELISARHASLPSARPDAWSDPSFSLSSNGRFVAFSSLASNLAANDTNANRDVFVRDLLNGTNILVSVGTNGFSADGMSFEPSISGDGRFVAFTSTATNILSGDNNRVRDVFVVDLQTKALAVATALNNSSYSPVISDDGRFLLFRSKASNATTNVIVAGSENLFLHELQSARTTALTTGGLTNAVMTPDGRFVAFIGRIPNSFTSGLYVWDSLAGTRIYTNTTPGILDVEISQNGSRLVYVTSATVMNLYAVDLLAKTNWAFATVQPHPRAGLKFSADGQWFVYAGPTVETGIDTNFVHDVFLYDFQAKTKTLVSRSYTSSQAANRASDYPDISRDGRFVVYRSAATNLVPDDTNDWSDLFIYDRLAATGSIVEHQSFGTNTLLSANALGKSGNNRSFPPIFSGDGRTLVFSSWASDLITNDFNQAGDLFSFAFLYATITRENPGDAPVISWPATSDGNYQVQFKNNVDDAAWQPLAGTITFMGNKAFIQDSSPAADQRIYRVVAF